MIARALVKRQQKSESYRLVATVEFLATKSPIVKSLAMRRVAGQNDQRAS
jgi:hypothetical protein